MACLKVPSLVGNVKVNLKSKQVKSLGKTQSARDAKQAAEVSVYVLNFTAAY
jgi:hypothetical protein